MTKSLEILKQAILLEKRGKSFYTKVAETTEHKSVKEFFLSMANEEQEHIRLLYSQYKSIKETNEFAASAIVLEPAEIAENVLGDELKEKISGADYESAAVAAAISMEEKAIELYSQRARETSSEEEKKLYQWLASWEIKHLKLLQDIDEYLTEKIWADNNFWPY